MRIEWNGKKLTKKRALFLCWKLWKWLAKNPGRNKAEWPEWGNSKNKVKYMDNDCPCCEFAGEDGEGVHACYRCPLLSYWGAGDVKYACERKTSSFNKWIGFGKSPKYAKRIAAAAKRRYDKC